MEHFHYFYKESSYDIHVSSPFGVYILNVQAICLFVRNAINEHSQIHKRVIEGSYELECAYRRIYIPTNIMWTGENTPSESGE